MKLHRVVAPLMLAVTTACVGTYRVEPAQYVQAHNPSQMLVMDNQGTLHLLENPTVKGDTIIGIESGTPDSLALPVNQVDDALVKHPSKGRTIALVGGLTAGVGLAFAAVITQGTHNPCKLGANKTNQAGNVIGGSTQCDTGGDAGETESRY